ncbi:hypothetical protein DQ04_10561000 [Trypanosoma grayi]|uniref:hypothetical protein n=1 Tax=Trypanosoma grayi TaxID=71804 RepID=UPI0004F42E0F|nr:hypothetical protein DQ04_10561000 [Trypanosoma grayi]KEG07206.1 hypothetical protein DQ04_10561000 [Trypanosoma grayi]
MRLRLKTPIIICHVNAAVTTMAAMRRCIQGRHLPSWRLGGMFGAAAHHQAAAVRWVATVTAAADTHGSASDFVDLDLDNLEDIHSKPREEQQPAIGVTREEEAPDEQEYSRFRIPLAHPRRGRPEPRPNSRSVISSNDALCVSDEDHGGGIAGAQHSSTGDVGDQDVSLPYDDEVFAEMLLEMEVEGAIDEAWQDARKAHMEDVVELVEVLRSLKVRDVCAIDVSAKTGNFDYMIFGTCEGPRHIHLSAWAVQEADSLKRVSKIRRKQTDHTWEVVTVGRIIVNLMQDSLREELSLERKWAVTKSMDPLAMANAPVSEGRQVRAHGLWTLTLNLQDLEDFEVDYCKDVLMRQL